MQNASSAASPAGGSNGHKWGAPALPNMYQTHQRITSNPRSYTPPDPNVSGSDARRDESSGQVYAGGEGYAYQPGVGFAPVSDIGYGYGAPSYSTSAPSAPSGSRRASGPKPASTPPASTSSTGANPSPGSRFYSQAGDGSTGHQQPQQSPYQPSSAPPQVSSQHHASMPGQPQTAHPYGGGYYSYYDPAQQHRPPGQYSHHYPQGGTHAINHSQSTSTAQQSTSTSTTPTINQSSTMGDQHRGSATGSSTAYSYPSTTSPYTAYSHDSRSGQWQTPGSVSRMNSQGTLTTVSQQTPWQGYPGQHAMPLPPHLAQGQGQGQGQYPWQQQWNPQYGYPPRAPHASQPTYMSNPPMPGAMMGGKKSKKDKHGVPMMGDYGGLGKRPADGGHEEDADGKKKKGKKEEEKPVPKPIAKSHLHPPRQAQSAWQLFFTDELNKAKATAALETSPGGTPQHVKLNVAQIAKDAGAAYASLDDEQREYYSQKVQESKEQYAKDLAVWQATLTPEDIRAENAFRAQQRKEGKSRKGNLKDPNAPKKPLSAYFLFLKGIREDDGLRSKVWGEETETTKQSVLAAERWRALSVEEKKVSHELRSWLILQPYLQQAEQDKQEYESARKMYEEDAAARARGEDVPPRPVHVPDVPIVKLELSKPRVKDVLREKPSKVAAKIEEPDFGEFTHETTEHDETDHSMEIADYQGFQDPLEDMDLSGFHGVTAPGAGEHGEQWDLQNLMGDAPEFRKPALDAISPAVSPEAAISAEAAVEGAATPAKDTEATSIAPTMAEAVAETTEDIPAVPAPPTANEEDVREVAAAAEGSLPVPQGLFEPSIDPETSGVPTEEVNELLLAGMPRAIDDLPMGTAVQVEAEAEAQVEAGFVVEPEKDEPMSEDVPGEPHSAETVAPPPETAGEVESLAAHPAESFDIAALTGEIAPEALELEEPDQIRAASVSTAIEAEELDQRGGEITSEAVEAGKRDQYGGIASQAIEGGKSDQQQGEIAPLVIDPHGPDLPSGPASPPAKEEVTAAPATATGLDDTPLENRDAPAADGV